MVRHSGILRTSTFDSSQTISGCGKTAPPEVVVEVRRRSAELHSTSIARNRRQRGGLLPQMARMAADRGPMVLKVLCLSAPSAPSAVLSVAVPPRCAVSRICNPQRVGESKASSQLPRSADCKSAIRQSSTLRYGKGAIIALPSQFAPTTSLCTDGKTSNPLAEPTRARHSARAFEPNENPYRHDRGQRSTLRPACARQS